MTEGDATGRSEGIEVNMETDSDDFGDLAAAARSSLDFWNNPEDDEDWNDA